MAQGIFAGVTSYEEQSLQDIVSDIEDWYNYATNKKTFMIDHKQMLDSNRFWNKIPNDFQTMLILTIAYFDTILYDLNLVKKAIINNNLSEREVNLLRKIGIKSGEYSHEYGRIYHKEEYDWKDYGNPHFKIAEEMYAKGRQFFVTLQDASNAASRLEDYMSNSNIVNNILSVSGNISNSQIQQNTTNSNQRMLINSDFDYGRVLEVLDEIKQYFDIKEFDKVFGADADKVKQVVIETIEMVNQKEEPSKIKKTLSLLKDLAIGVSGSIIASGIYSMIEQLPIW